MDELTPDTPTLLEMTRALAGDGASLGLVLERYRRRLAAAVIAAGVYRGVDDVVQDAMVKIVTAVQNQRLHLRSTEEFRAWANSIARHCAIDALRREEQQPRHLESILAPDRDSAAPAERIPSREAGPSACARSNELEVELRRQVAARIERIASLRPQDQMLVWMRERDGLSFAAIAAQLGDALQTTLTEDAMRMRYARVTRDRIGPAIEGGDPPPVA